MRFRRRRAPMPAEFEALARYNTERARGIVHTAATDAEMSERQARFDAWINPDNEWAP